jgi:hypothetical protein
MLESLDGITKRGTLELDLHDPAVPRLRVRECTRQVPRADRIRGNGSFR